MTETGAFISSPRGGLGAIILVMTEDPDKGLWKISGFNREREHLSQGDKLSLWKMLPGFIGSAAATSYSCSADRLGRTVAFPARNADRALPREAACATAITDHR